MKTFILLISAIVLAGCSNVRDLTDREQAVVNACTESKGFTRVVVLPITKNLIIRCEFKGT